MIHPHYFILYVNDPLQSSAFYSDLLSIQPVELQATFALFVLDNGIKLGLWSKHTVEPATNLTGGGSELGFSLTSPQQVDEWYAVWQRKGLTILQMPTDMDFGYTFLATDPDAHRLRVFALNQS